MLVDDNDEDEKKRGIEERRSVKRRKEKMEREEMQCEPQSANVLLFCEEEYTPAPEFEFPPPTTPNPKLARGS